VWRDDDVKRLAITALMSSHEPWEVAWRVHEAAVKAVPTLDQLIGHLAEWSSGDDREDAITWLNDHASDLKLREIGFEIPAYPRTRFVTNEEDGGYWSTPDARDIVELASPPELLAAWHCAVGPAPSDLTDAEWELFKPFLPPAGPTSPWTERRLATTRRAVSAMAYQLTNHLSWSHVPSRYGKYQTIYLMFRTFKKQGVFARALSAFDGNPDAARIVTWLQSTVR
jgi:transposase